MRASVIITAAPISHNQFRSPLGVIASEHNRQLQLCDRIEDLASNRHSESLLQEAMALRAYFMKDLPLHCRDEEEDLFPMLKLACRPDDGVDRILAELERDHAVEMFLGRHVIVDLKANIRGGPNDSTLRLFGNLSTFCKAQRRHVDWENIVVLPLAQRRLSAANQEEMGRNMAARRGMSFPT